MAELFTPQEYERFKEFQKNKEMQEFLAFKNNPGATSTPSANVLHGLNPSGTVGLFGSVGVDPRMYSAVVRANGSFSAALPFKGSRILQMRKEIVAGVGPSTGTNPGNFCAPGMTAGPMSVCRQDYEFGNVLIDTENVDLINTGAYYTLADQDRDVIPPLVQNAPFMPDVVNGANPNSQTFNQFYRMGVGLGRSSEVALIQGLKTAPATGAGSLAFFNSQPDGVDRLIRSGYTDVVSNTACTSMDSRVQNFGAVNVTGSAANGTIVDYITDMFGGLEMDLFGNGPGAGMGYDMNSSSFAILMHPRAWRPITRMWPCAYQTTGCNTIVNGGMSGVRVDITAESQREMQDQMFNGKYLMIDGNRIPVLFSWGVPIATVAPDTYNTSIYIVPLRLNGAAVTFVEYFDVGNEMQEQFANLAGPSDTRVINGGMYRVGRQDQPFCITYKVAGKWRLRFDAPFAAGRIDNVQVSDRTRMHSPFPGESYYTSGTATSRPVY